MSREDKDYQEALKELRKKRAASVDKAKQAIKDHSLLIQKIKEQIQDGAKTVPEIAAATRIPASQVLLYISGLRKYGLVSEGAKEGDYFKWLIADSWGKLALEIPH